MSNRMTNASRQDIVDYRPENGKAVSQTLSDYYSLCKLQNHQENDKCISVVDTCLRHPTKTT